MIVLVGVETPYPLKRVLSPFQGDTNNSFFVASVAGGHEQPFFVGPVALSFPEREGGPCVCTVDRFYT